MPGRRLLAPLLIGVTLGLTPLAQASPSDQTWIAGIYDNGDHDDAVMSIIGGVASLELPPPGNGRPARTVVDVVWQPDASARATFAVSSDHTRAPPAS